MQGKVCGKKRHTKTEIRSEISELICGRIAAGENYNLTRDKMSEWIKIRIKDFYKDAIGEVEYAYVTKEVYEALQDTFRKEVHAQKMKDLGNYNDVESIVKNIDLSPMITSIQWQLPFMHMGHRYRQSGII